jgi:hypothetical protein
MSHASHAEAFVRPHYSTCQVSPQPAPGESGASATTRRYKSHLLVALNGSSERAIAKTTQDRSRRVLLRYFRPGELFLKNAAASLGL